MLCSVPVVVGVEASDTEATMGAVDGVGPAVAARPGRVTVGSGVDDGVTVTSGDGVTVVSGVGVSDADGVTVTSVQAAAAWLQ